MAVSNLYKDCICRGYKSHVHKCKHACSHTKTNLHLVANKPKNSNFFTFKVHGRIHFHNCILLSLLSLSSSVMSATSNFTFPLTQSCKSSLNSWYASSVCLLPFLFLSHIPFSHSLYVDVSCFHHHPLCNPLAILRLGPFLMYFLSVFFYYFIITIFYHFLLITLFPFLYPTVYVCLCSIMLSLSPHLHFFPPLFAHPLCTSIYFQNL